MRFCCFERIFGDGKGFKVVKVIKVGKVINVSRVSEVCEDYYGGLGETEGAAVEGGGAEGGDGCTVGLGGVAFVYFPGVAGVL